MNLFKKLEKIKLPLTPRRVAVQHLDWAFTFLLTKNPNPLMDVLKQMKSDIDGRTTLYDRADVNQDAEKEVHFLVELFVLSFIALMEDLAASLQLNSAGELWTPDPHPEFCKRMIERRNELEVSLATLEHIQIQFLGARVLPLELSVLILTFQMFSLWRLILGFEGIGERVLEPDDITKRARSKVRELAAVARQSACLESSARAAFSLLRPLISSMRGFEDFQFSNRLKLDKWKQALGLATHMRSNND